ncbi:hypothetical protein HDU76_006541 [Blyttiomyces sp. JEL0837]|nr:hypothetical protein HDU76_006541 [Blyttiomyces sp. JEL0837]
MAPNSSVRGASANLSVAPPRQGRRKSDRERIMQLVLRYELFSLGVTVEMLQAYKNQTSRLTTHPVPGIKFDANGNEIRSPTTATSSSHIYRLHQDPDPMMHPPGPSKMPALTRSVYLRWIRAIPLFAGRGEAYMRGFDDFVEGDFYPFVASWIRATKFDLVGFAKHHLAIFFFAYPEEPLSNLIADQEQEDDNTNTVITTTPTLSRITNTIMTTEPVTRDLIIEDEDGLEDDDDDAEEDDDIFEDAVETHGGMNSPDPSTWPIGSRGWNRSLRRKRTLGTLSRSGASSNSGSGNMLVSAVGTPPPVSVTQIQEAVGDVKISDGKTVPAGSMTNGGMNGVDDYFSGIDPSITYEMFKESVVRRLAAIDPNTGSKSRVEDDDGTKFGPGRFVAAGRPLYRHWTCAECGGNTKAFCCAEAPGVKSSTSPPLARDKVQEMRYKELSRSWDEFLKTGVVLLEVSKGFTEQVEKRTGLRSDWKVGGDGNVNGRRDSREKLEYAAAWAIMEPCRDAEQLDELPDIYLKWCRHAVRALAVTVENVLDDHEWQRKVRSIWSKLPLSLIVGSLRIINPVPFVEKLLKLFVWKPAGMHSLLQKLASILCASDRTSKHLRDLRPSIQSNLRTRIENAMDTAVLFTASNPGCSPPVSANVPTAVTPKWTDIVKATIGSEDSDQALTGWLVAYGVHELKPNGAASLQSQHNTHGHKPKHHHYSSGGHHGHHAYHSHHTHHDHAYTSPTSQILQYARLWLRRREKEAFVDGIGSDGITKIIVHVAHFLPPFLTEMWECIDMAMLCGAFFAMVTGILEALGNSASNDGDDDDESAAIKRHEEVVSNIEKHIWTIFEKGYPFVHALSKRKAMGPTGIHAFVDWFAREFGEGMKPLDGEAGNKSKAETSTHGTASTSTRRCILEISAFDAGEVTMREMMKRDPARVRRMWKEVESVVKGMPETGVSEWGWGWQGDSVGQDGATGANANETTHVFSDMCGVRCDRCGSSPSADAASMAARAKEEVMPNEAVDFFRAEMLRQNGPVHWPGILVEDVDDEKPGRSSLSLSGGGSSARASSTGRSSPSTSTAASSTSITSSLSKAGSWLFG